MKYMILIYADPAAAPARGTPEQAQAHEEWSAVTQAMHADGAFISGDALQDADTATTVRVRGGDTLTTDGPFAETKEVLGGYYLIDVDGLDQALAWAARLPNVTYGSVEVRPLAEIDMGLPT
jgi:hypothetical protein